MKVGKYLLISTTVLGLVNPLVALADDQNNTKLSQPLESVEHSDNQRDSQKLGDKNKSSELYNTSNVKEDGVSPDRDKTEKTSVKPVADSEHIKFADANLEKIVIKALHIPSSQNYVTLDDIKNFSGNYLPIQNIFADSIEFSSLEGLEALKNLPSNIPVELSLRLKPNVSLKPISNLNLKWGLSIDKDGKWTSEDIKALNSINVVDGGLYSGLELSAGYDSTQNKDGLTNEQIKELDPLFSEVINKGTSLINLNAQAISDFTYFNKFKNIQLSATNQYNIFNDSPITLKEGAKNISFNSQIKGIDGTRLTDDIYTWNTSDHKEGMNYGPINGKNGIYTINNYIDYSQVPGYIVSYASYMDESGNYKRHSYANGNTLLYSGYSYYKTVKEDELKIVNVNYVDEEGNSLANSEVLRGNVGDSYKADEKTIPGYIFAEAKDGNESGKFT
ncbi:MucBP domain-containing protein, partial [Weissella kandleri]|uniref:MucBP domain-containing protein n=1 Tax=Weissella kandleri TaxID=1616 RepID=UPI00138F93AC